MAFAQQLARSSLPLTTTSPSVFTSPIRFRASSLPISANNKTTKFRNWVTNFNSKSLSFFLSGALSLGISLTGKCLLFPPQLHCRMCIFSLVGVSFLLNLSYYIFT
ncbi:hypothetical protein WN943_003631 [Citrus x changshan-huyou]